MPDQKPELIAELERVLRDKKKPCKDGWNYHVYCLGADRCSICGARR